MSDLEGSRWEDRDSREGNRVVRVINARDLSNIEVEVEVAEFNPKTIGRQSRMTEKNLQTRYRKISR